MLKTPRGRSFIPGAMVSTNGSRQSYHVRRMRSVAEANYNSRVSSSLTPVLIQQQYLSRWDGRLPQYSLGGSVVPFIQIPGAPAPASAPEAPRR